MSTITLQLGQCGNQLGYEFLQKVYEESVQGKNCDADAFFRQRQDGVYVPRALLVDMEPKVVHASMHRAQASRANWKYDAANVVLENSGSGNNWAHGYHVHGARCSKDVMIRLRREVERCDHFGGVLLIQSLAGGTGAGFGSRIAEDLCDRFPSTLRTSYAVWPYDSGEVLVQAYNSLLSMDKLLEMCDGVILTRNEDLHATCVNVHNQARPTFQDLNAVAAHALGSLMCPCHHREITPQATDRGVLTDKRQPSKAASPATTKHVSPHRLAAQHNTVAELSRIPEQLGRGVTMGDILQQIAASAVKYTTFSWNASLRRLLQMFITHTTCPERLNWSTSVSEAQVKQGFHGFTNKSAGSFAILRGLLAPQADAGVLADPALYPDWLPGPLGVAASAASYQRLEMCCTLLSSDQSCVPPLSMAVDKFGAMARVGAFIHQYEQHSLSKDELLLAMHGAQDVVAHYQSL